MTDRFGMARQVVAQQSSESSNMNRLCDHPNTKSAKRDGMPCNAAAINKPARKEACTPVAPSPLASSGCVVARAQASERGVPGAVRALAGITAEPPPDDSLGK
eukprot:2828066-Alexandrium_andersonii.AAC.1